jgi:hypothetical protein
MTPCPLCTHPQRHQIEQALHRSAHAVPRVAWDFALPLEDVARHLPHVAWPPTWRAPCLPGWCEPFGYTPPGATPTCRHCGAPLPAVGEEGG